MICQPVLQVLQGFQDVHMLPLPQHSHPLLSVLVVLDDLGVPGRTFQQDQRRLENGNQTFHTLQSYWRSLWSIYTR